MHENEVSAEKLAADLRLVVSDAEALLRATVGQVGETAAAARATDDYVRENPWQAVGVAVLAGIALGLLISRR
jgi:ElaB/YqjD/DUF883 family membrane-anchored ribosome-binding protein